MLHWAWQSVSTFALMRAMSLASTNPHEMLHAQTAAGPVSLLQSNYGNDRQSWDSMSPAGCGPYYKIRMLLLQNVALGMAGCL